MKFLIDSDKDELRDQDMWIGHSGATCYMTNQLDCTFDTEEVDQSTIFGDSKKLKVTNNSQIQVLNGNEILFTREEVKYGEGIWEHTLQILY
jgi:hypothetical protein